MSGSDGSRGAEMDIFCKLGKHSAEPSDRWNDGYYFTRCARCGIDLIKRSSDWRAVPRGYRVVWRPRQSWEIDWTEWTRRRKPADLVVAKGEWLPGTDSNHRPSD
jgi:hypothetical protein